MKNLLATILTGVIFSTMPVAPASPLDIRGTATIKYESDTADNSPTQSGTMYSITLRGEQKIGHNPSLFARFGAQYAGNPTLADFNPAVLAEDAKVAAGLDQYGLIYKL